MDPLAEQLAQLMDPRQMAAALLNDLVRSDREARIVRAAAACDLAAIYRPQREVHRQAVALCDGAIELLEELRRRLVVGTKERT